MEAARGAWTNTVAATPCVCAEKNSILTLERSLCDLLRDIFGNPFHALRIATASWLERDEEDLIREVFDEFARGIQSREWNLKRGDLVSKIANTIYHEGRFTELPVLADALEESGCTDSDILTHCRGPGPHVRGCWVVDLILGKQ